MTEDELIATLFAPLAGPGGFGLKDDAAVLSAGPGDEIVTTVDALVAGVHFFPEDPPASIAVKALAVNLSDLAAKAAVPSGFLLVLAMPPQTPAEWLHAFAAALGIEATRHGCPLLGGDTVQTPGPLTLSITAFGTVPRDRMVPRTGLKIGDRIYVTGTIGDAALGLTLRSAKPQNVGLGLERLPLADRDALCDRYLHPRPRLALVHVLRAHATAAMDVSDGLVGDLRKMLGASDVGGRVDFGRTPFSTAAQRAINLEPHAWSVAVTGGDDYELLVGIPAEKVQAFERDALATGTPVTCLGETVGASGGVLFLDRDGQPLKVDAERFQHMS